MRPQSGLRPLILIVGMLASKDCEGFLMNFAVLICRVIAVPIQQDTALRPKRSHKSPAASASGPRPRDSVGDALATISALGLDPAPPNPHYRHALSRRGGACRERHIAERI